MKKDIIIWVEERPDTVSNQILFCKKKGFKVITTATPHRLAEELEKNEKQVALIIMDIMLFPIISLESIGIPDSFTDSGYQAGWVIMERFLRPLESSELLDKYKDIPILILTTQRLYKAEKERLDNLKIRGKGWVKYLEKGGIDKEGNLIWTESFEKIIKNLLGELDRGTE